MQDIEEKIFVYIRDKKVGTLVKSKRSRLVSFFYSDEWIKDGYSINPFSLPLRRGQFVPSKKAKSGLFGVFDDSMPDSWGSLLLDRHLSSKGIDPNQISILERLSFVGSNGFGAIRYVPSNNDSLEIVHSDFDLINEECQKILANKKLSFLDDLFIMGGSSGGSRPKVYAEIDGDNWIVKFPHRNDPKNIGIMEYDYMSTAKACGIEIPDIKIVPSKKYGVFFAVKRFDFVDGEKIHCVSASGLLEEDFQSMLLDYVTLLKLTKVLTRDDKAVWQMYRRMCFNIFAKNQDDHGKNFTFFYDEHERVWHLAPAYDLTYSPTAFGEQSTMVNGKGKNITMEDLVNAGVSIGLPKRKCGEIAESIYLAVKRNLTKYIK